MLQKHPSPATLNVAADTTIDAAENLFGKVVSDLQNNVAISDGEITGTLNHVEGYTGFSGDAELQNGNFLALHFTAAEGATIGVEVIGGASEGNPVTLDPDGIIVLRIASTTQKVKATATLEGVTESKTYNLTNLTLANE